MAENSQGIRLMSKGERSQSKIVRILQVYKSTISRDVAYLKNK
jgi:DeoR/GlpR family transcriptional regulator of sugar metabolism